MSNLLTRTLTSMEVSEMVERRHDQVLRDIENIIYHLGDHKSVESYFIRSFYMNSQNKEQPCFDVTKKGCELYGTRMNGAKGTLFAVEYIERFNEMEESVKERSLPTDPMDILALTFEAQKQHKEELKLVGNRVTNLEENVSIDQGDYSYLTRRINKAVFQELEIKRFSKHKKQVDLFYKDINKGIHEITGVKTRSKLKQKQFDAVDNFITDWKPSTATITLAEQIELLEEVEK
ncbi:Rha family transcriptional regulator [Carnobacterium maltaromaticum]|uniref:Rha family transcriptional regulator n=1 Tax=Carnobacterium maltaromaticum TaxID=2751 RepID=UPI0039AECDA3